MKSVLLIEDDKKLTLALGVRLKAMGYSVDAAPDAVTAISVARRNPPDVIVIDINLPGGDGFVVAERIQTLQQTATIPVIFMTGSKEPGLHERARQAGGLALLEKPFDVSQLSSAIESASFVEGPFKDMVTNNEETFG